MKQKNLKQILLHVKRHLDANKISFEHDTGGWYCGSHDAFVMKHNAAKEWVDKMIEEVDK